jgi:hypothetical protein
MHNYIAHIVCCASFTSIRLLAINKLWIDGYNKPILIYAHSAVYKPKNLKLLILLKFEFEILKFKIRNSISNTTNQEKAFKLRFFYGQWNVF